MLDSLKSNDIRHEEDLRIALRSAMAGNGILFLGAGASKDAKDKKGEPLPAGQELADFLATECDLGQGYSLEDISSHFIKVRSETALINALRKRLTVSSVGDSLISLSKIDWVRVWTTNYDDSYEKALGQKKDASYSLTTSASVSNAQGNKRIVFHINGFLGHIKQAFAKDFILTSKSYATQSFVDSEWATVFKNDIQQCKVIIFVGYSLADIDIARLIFNPNMLYKKIHFVDKKDINPVLNSKLSMFGKVHSIGLEKLKDIINEELITWVKPQYIESYKSWQKLEIESDLTEASDDDFYDLLIRGISKDGLVLEQLSNPETPIYTVIRTCEEKCIKQSNENDVIVVVLGSFVNGKTTTIRSVMLKLAAEGRDVFYLDHPYDSAYAELQKLCRRDSNFVLVIENYARNLDLIECFCLYARNDCTLILSERTERHELSLTALNDRVKSRVLYFHELDILDDYELRKLSSLLEVRGLWGESRFNRKSKTGIFERRLR